MTVLETVVSRSKQLRPRTKELYLQHVRAFLTFVGTAKKTWTTADVLHWRDQMKKEIRPQSVNVALNALRYAAQEAKLGFFTEDIDRLPTKATKVATIKEQRPLTWKEGLRLVGTCAKQFHGRDIRDLAIITLGLRTGMLRFSMCQLTFADVGIDASLTFCKKGGERHTFLLDSTTIGVLDAWMDWLRGHGVERGPLFRSLGRQHVRVEDDVTIGARLTPDGLYRAVRERAQQAGLGDIRPHVFHKTFVAWARKAGAGGGQIAAVTGHRSDADGDDLADKTPGANMLLEGW